jgi:hypothetical protein
LVSSYAKAASKALHFVSSRQLFNLVKPGIPATALRIPGFHPSIPGFIFLDFDLKL